MSIRPDILQDICNMVTRQVLDLHPNLETVFIIHGNSRFAEILETREHEIFRHAGAKVISHILEKNNTRDLSGFLGMAITHELKWLGLASTEKLLAIFNLNSDEFNTPKEARREIYHMLWHALDLVNIRRRPEYAAKFRSGPMIPKRSPLNFAKLNLEADIFASTMSALLGEEDALQSLAASRAVDSISPVHLRRAEDYPFIISLDAAQFAHAALMRIKPKRNEYLVYAAQVAHEVGRAFDDKSIRSWWGFSEPAQDMAWRKFPKEVILGCALHTSEDAFVRAIGHLVCEITKINPLSGLKLEGTYNTFAPQEQNKLLHREIMEKTFEEAVAKGVEEDSGTPLILAANQQNENLAEGIILGWCGHALQAAARAFDSAKKTGASPIQAARMEFEGTKDIPDWETLREIGSKVVEQKRQGYAMTLGNVAQICSENPLFVPMLGSIRITMKDPNFIHKLQAANDMNLKGFGPSAAPSAPAPKGPSPIAPQAPGAYYAPSGPSGPSLGGASRSGRMRRPTKTVPPEIAGRDKNIFESDDDRAK